ncbi:hypothetical protein KIL84_015957, partial [Mauremys mutica]
RYRSSVGRKELLRCEELPQNTTDGEIFWVLNEYVTGHGLQWDHCIGICMDGMVAMTGRHTGLMDLAAKKSSPDPNDVLSIVIKIVNFVKANGLNSCLFATMKKWGLNTITYSYMLR